MKALLESGEVIVAGEPRPFEEEEIGKTQTVLLQWYESDKLEMPSAAPAYDPAAAAWGAAFLYRTIQFILLRELGEEELNAHLPASDAPETAAAVYSADLSLRHLPDLFRFAKGLAPGDPLLQRMNEVAARWPFSSVGIDIAADADLRLILEHPSLRIAYADRIIQRQSSSRLLHPAVPALVEEVLGQHQTLLWPSYTHPVSLSPV